jgi:hypothetical protein
MKTNTHFLSYLAQFFYEWEIFQTKVGQKIKTHILCSIFFYENRAVYMIMWKNTVDSGRSQMTTQRSAIFVTEATSTNSEYVIFIYFSLQKLFQEPASVLRYTYIAFF